MKAETNKQNDPSGNDYQKVLLSAFRILTGRDHSRYELVHKLRQRGFMPTAIEKAVSECERLDFINDERTSQVYIRQLIRKGYGARRIRLDLKKKGLRGHRIQSILSEMISDTDEPKAAERVYKKNFYRFERENDPKKRKDKIYRFLHVRGFSPETIQKLLTLS